MCRRPLTPFDRLRVSGDWGRGRRQSAGGMGGGAGGEGGAGRPVHGVAASMAWLHVASLARLGGPRGGFSIAGLSRWRAVSLCTLAGDVTLAPVRFSLRVYVGGAIVGDAR